RVAWRCGEKRAIVAVAHSLLTIIYHLLTRGALYADLGERYFDELDPERRTRYYVRQLTELGYKVELEPASAA
ncbi:MAG TPA: IS110 family transposase, partial [Candidatus Tectomicrobia bacterium]|nr:IS110 family transposase [Candidatus Tectomicrobia bacterium]